MIDTCNSLSLIFLNQCPDYFEGLFCHAGENDVIAHSSNKNLKLPFQKTKLGFQNYMGPNTWNSLPNNLKSATSVNSFKHLLNFYLLQ